MLLALVLIERALEIRERRLLIRDERARLWIELAVVVICSAAATIVGLSTVR